MAKYTTKVNWTGQGGLQECVKGLQAIKVAKIREQVKEIETKADASLTPAALARKIEQAIEREFND